MGRLIDADVLREEVSSWGMNDFEPSDFTDAIDEAPTVEAITKDQYEARLKDDLVAMLTEIQLEIREYHEIGCDEDCNNCRMVGCIEPVNVIKDLDIIQQKIDKLKESKDEV